jgi:hypothetical protein
MQFKLTKTLANGRYFLKIELVEFSDLDKRLAQKFGSPVINIRRPEGSFVNVAITTLQDHPPFGFYKLEEAEQYADSVKKQILAIKSRWLTLQDTWTNEEIL